MHTCVCIARGGGFKECFSYRREVSGPSSLSKRKTVGSASPSSNAPKSSKPLEPSGFKGSMQGVVGGIYGIYWPMLAVFWALSSSEPVEPREGEPRQPNKAHEGRLGAIGAYSALLGRPCLGLSGFYDECSNRASPKEPGIGPIEAPDWGLNGT